MRKLGNSATPVVELTCEGDEYTFTTTTMLKTTTIKFKLGEEFEEERGDGAKVKSTITMDGNKMTHVMKGEPESTIVREFNGDEMKAVSLLSNLFCSMFFSGDLISFYCFFLHQQVLTVNDVVCTRIYKAE